MVAAGYAVVSHKGAEVEVKGRKQQVGPRIGLESSFSWNVWTLLFYFRKDWCSDEEMAYHCGDMGLDSCDSDDDQIHRASLVWKNNKYVDGFG